MSEVETLKHRVQELEDDVIALAGEVDRLEEELAWFRGTSQVPIDNEEFSQLTFLDSPDVVDWADMQAQTYHADDLPRTDW